jgi:hypothetical protein
MAKSGGKLGGGKPVSIPRGGKPSPGLPSTTGKPSGKGRDNLPPSPKPSPPPPKPRSNA